MQTVKEYIFSLMIIAFSCAIVEILAPEDKGISRYLHFTAALVITVVLLSPVQSILGVLPDILELKYDLPVFAEINASDEYTDAVITESINKIKEEINAEVMRKFNCEAVEIMIEYDASDIENIVISKVLIGYDVSNRYLYSDTENYIEELMKCDCEVYLCDE